MIGPKEFECIDCGIWAIRVIDHAANDDPVCVECSFIRSIADPVEREQVRRILQRDREPSEPIPDDQPTVQLCETCGSEGFLCGLYEGKCTVCEGTGGALIATQPVDEEEIMLP